MSKMHVSEFCGIAEEGKKADAIGKAFTMFKKALDGEFEIDKSLQIFNHVPVGTIWLFSHLAVDLGFVNHPFFIEAWQNVMNEEASAPIGTAHVDSKAGTQTKKSAPGKDPFLKQVTPGFTWTVMQQRKKTKMWPEKFCLSFFIPITGGRHEGSLVITTEQLFKLNPQWNNEYDRDQDYCVYLSADRDTGKPKTTCKYSPYIQEII